MTTFLCIRHGKCEPIGKYIAGRMSGIQLNNEGRKEVAILAQRLKDIDIEKVYSSPLERACETSDIICKAHNLDYEIQDQLNEIDYGDWSGKTFKELKLIPEWNLYNQLKSTFQVPNGEMLIDIEQRISTFTEKMRRIHKGVVVLVSHAEPIKCLIAHYLGISLDLIGRIEIDPASVSVLVLEDDIAHITCCNNTE